MEVGREGHAGREEPFAVLALRLAVELLPPLVDILELRFVGTQNLDLLARFVQCITHRGIDRRGVLREGDLLARGTLHLLGAAYQRLDVDTGGGQRQQSHRREHREPAAHIVGNDEGGVALVVGQRLQGTARTVGNGHDTLGGPGLAVTPFDLRLDDAEGHGRFGRRPRLGDDDRRDRMVLDGIEQFVGILFREILTGEDDHRLLARTQRGERIAHRLRNGFGTQIGTADTDADNHVGTLAQLLGFGPDARQLLRRDRRGKGHPSQEIVAGALLRIEQRERLAGALLHAGSDLHAGLRNIKFQCFHNEIRN